MTNALTLDVEDYWSIFFRYWLNKNTEPSEAVIRNTEWFLETLARYNVEATCFILGEVAQKHPSLVKKIAENGHEIGSHGFSHKQIFKLNRNQFRDEIATSKKLLEDITGQAVRGYRAPAFSIMPETKWALDVLAEEDYRYDSSVYPIAGKRYGWPGFRKDICQVALPSGRTIIEAPLSTVTVFGKTLPVAGGGYLRHFPYLVTKMAMSQIQKKRPAIVYMHPYEVDVDNKKFDLSSMSYAQRCKVMKFHRLQLRNRKTVAGKLINLLIDYEFTTLSNLIEKTFQ
ncbi:MAG: polysaccharide deacetylase family protein [Planctomycetota bacterium]|jgi:polysaccharide deacetylase family protein (PEP-CTERM system associated)